MKSAALRFLRAAADQAVAENVLLGDDGEIVGLETLLEAEHDRG